MGSWMVVGALLGAVAMGGAARAAEPDLDVAKVDAKHHKVEFENEYVRIVRANIPPHEKTALHSHPSLVSVFLTDADLKITAPDGKVSEAHAKKGSAAWRGPTTHVAENIGDKPIEQIIVEPKGAPKADWKAPPNDATKVTKSDRLEFENEWVRIVRFEIPKGETSPMHDHPTNVQILLSDAHARQSTPDGKSSETNGKAGVARFRPALSHEVVNLGDTYGGIVVDLKNAPAAPR
jgi:quercetin dioxygenase-like cupin family protein